MHPVSSIERFERHVGEKLLAGFNVAPVDIIRVFPLDEQGRAGPRYLSGLIGKFSDRWNAFVDDIQGYPEFDRLVGGGDGVGQEKLSRW